MQASDTTLLKKRLWHRCSPVNFAKFPRTPFIIEYPWWRLLDLRESRPISGIYRLLFCSMFALNSKHVFIFWEKTFPIFRKSLYSSNTRKIGTIKVGIYVFLTLFIEIVEIARERFHEVKCLVSYCYYWNFKLDIAKNFNFGHVRHERQGRHAQFCPLFFSDQFASFCFLMQPMSPQFFPMFNQFWKPKDL